MTDAILNADVRELPITIGEHTVTVAELVNVAVGLDSDMAFGTEYLNRFDIRQTPTVDDVCAWINEPLYAEYTDMIDKQAVGSLIDLLGKIQAEIAVAEIRAKAESMGFAVSVIEVPFQSAPKVPEPEVEVDDGIRRCDCCGEETGDWHEWDMPFVEYLCDNCVDV